jgi:predicted phosphate transport protein (TIGR00153 family)
MFKFLLPKEHGFFDQFDKHAATAMEAAQLFVEMLDHFGDAPAKARRIAEVEHRADEIGHHTLEMLHSTFITPLDRDQIHALIGALDDVVDLIDGAARRLILYGITEPTPPLRELARTLMHSVEEMQKAVSYLRDLRNAKKILKACVEINKLENDGDALRDDAIANLLKNEKNAVEVLKWKELYESVETALDCCEEVANIIEGVVLENN